MPTAVVVGLPANVAERIKNISLGNCGVRFMPEETNSLGVQRKKSKYFLEVDGEVYKNIGCEFDTAANKKLCVFEKTDHFGRKMTLRMYRDEMEIDDNSGRCILKRKVLA